MSGLDSIPLDTAGFLDMDRIAPDGSDLSEAEVAGIRSALHDDPVLEPDAAEWTGLVDGVLDADDGGAGAAGPFAVDGDDGLAGLRATDDGGAGGGPEIVDSSGALGPDGPADLPGPEEAAESEVATEDPGTGGLGPEGGLEGGDLLDQALDLLESAPIDDVGFDEPASGAGDLGACGPDDGASFGGLS